MTEENENEVEMAATDEAPADDAEPASAMTGDAVAAMEVEEALSNRQLRRRERIRRLRQQWRQRQRQVGFPKKSDFENSNTGFE